MGGQDGLGSHGRPLCSRLLLVIVVVAVVSVLISSLVTYLIVRPTPEVDINNRESVMEEAVAVPGPAASELRIPRALQPDTYSLFVRVFLPGYEAVIPAERNLTFDGELAINFTASDVTDAVVLNVKNLTFTDESFVVEKETPEGMKQIDVRSWKVSDELEKLTIELADTVETGDKIRVQIHYTGLISDILGGLYQATYTDGTGTARIAAVTQMEATDARRMVPCLDEPAFKATWDVVVEHPKGTTALSNGIEDGEAVDSTESGWLRSKFKRTPKMSSYLLAIFIGNFDYSEQRSLSGTRVRVWSRPESVNQTRYSVTAGAKVLAYYEQFYGINFPLEKLDMVAVPDFSAGAMENWGLVTYRETALLYDERCYGMGEKQRVAVVVAHELAHQWFGNLVTMEWWEDLWLNEGFATLVEYIGTDVISEKKFHMTQQFIEDAQLAAQTMDALSTSHPLSFKIERAIEVSEAFDSITYQKGGSVLSMIRAVMGENAFLEGLKVYLARHSYGNARAADLWVALDEAAKKAGIRGPDGQLIDIPHFATQWTTQMGFPLLTAARQNETSVRLSQSRFKIDKDGVEKKKYREPEFGFKWDVPVWYQRGADSRVQMTWLPRDGHVDLLLPPETPLVLNAGSLGFYRALYGDGGWRDIKRQLDSNFQLYTPETRGRLISDMFAASETGLLPYADLFDMIEYIKSETEYLPWAVFFAGMRDIRERLGTEPVAHNFKRYMRKLLAPVYRKADMASLNTSYMIDDKHLENVRDAAIIGEMCKLDDSACVDERINDFLANLIQSCREGGSARSSDCSRVIVPLRHLTYCLGVKYGTPSIYERVQELFVAEDLQIEKNKLMNAMTCTTDIAQLKRLLLGSLARQGAIIRQQDIGLLFQAAARNPVGRLFLQDFFFQHWDTIYETLEATTSILNKVIESCNRGMATEEEIKRLVTWRESHEEAKGLDMLNKALAAAYKQRDWRATHLATLSDYFAKH